MKKRKIKRTPASGDKKSSIRAKLTALIVPAVVLMIVILIVISAYFSTQRIKQMATDELASSISNQADNISAWMNENLADFSSIKYMIEQTKPDDKGLQAIIDSTYGYNSNAADGMHIGEADGTVIKPSDQTRRAPPGISRELPLSPCILARHMRTAREQRSSVPQA